MWLAREGDALGVGLHDAVVAHLGIAAASVDVAPDEVDPDLWETPSYSSSGEEVARRAPWSGGTYAWIAGESTVVTGLRRHLVSELGLRPPPGRLHGLLAPRRGDEVLTAAPSRAGAGVS